MWSRLRLGVLLYKDVVIDKHGLVLYEGCMWLCCDESLVDFRFGGWVGGAVVYNGAA